MTCFYVLHIKSMHTSPQPMQQELLTLPKHTRSSMIFYGVSVGRSLVFYVVFCRSLFVLFLLAIVLSVLRFTASDNPFGIYLNPCLITLWYSPLITHGLIDREIIMNYASWMWLAVLWFGRRVLFCTYITCCWTRKLLGMQY